MLNTRRAELILLELRASAMVCIRVHQVVSKHFKAHKIGDKMLDNYTLEPEMKGRKVAKQQGPLQSKRLSYILL